MFYIKVDVLEFSIKLLDLQQYMCYNYYIKYKVRYI